MAARVASSACNGPSFWMGTSRRVPGTVVHREGGPCKEGVHARSPRRESMKSTGRCIMLEDRGTRGVVRRSHTWRIRQVMHAAIPPWAVSSHHLPASRLGESAAHVRYAPVAARTRFERTVRAKVSGVNGTVTHGDQLRVHMYGTKATTAATGESAWRAVALLKA